jgi:hypothetical protein
MRRLHAPSPHGFNAAAVTQPLFDFETAEPTAREAPSARRTVIAAPREGRAVTTIEAPPAEQSRRRLAQGTNADGYATPLDEDDQPTRGRRPLPRRPSSRNMAA